MKTTARAFLAALSLILTVSFTPSFAADTEAEITRPRVVEAAHTFTSHLTDLSASIFAQVRESAAQLKTTELPATTSRITIEDPAPAVEETTSAVSSQSDDKPASSLEKALQAEIAEVIEEEFLTEDTVTETDVEEEPETRASSLPAGGESPAHPWIISYYVDLDAPEADPQGMVTMIKPEGYFEAHRWSANGQKIATLPEWIQVDGILYQFAGLRVGSYLESPEFYPDWWRPFWNHDGCIGLQTCEGDYEYLVLCYRPA